MATGVRGGERIGAASKTAARPHADPNPLPIASATVRLEYVGKITEEQILSPLKASFSELDEDARVSKGLVQPNALVLSDNLFALHHLLLGKERPSLIYFDPPYGTGMEFQTRQLERAYKDVMGQAAYLEFMRRRLVLMRELLSDDGSIYVHIGHQMVGHFKVLMDEIFGARNFRNLIVRKKCSSKNSTRKQYPNLHDYLLFYTKSQEFIWNQPTETPTGDWLSREYGKKDERGHFKMVPIHAPGVRNGETGKPWRGVMPPPGKHWQYVPSKLEELDAKGEMHWSKNGNPRRKVYLSEDKQLPLTDYWKDYRDAHHQSIQITGYPTEKNLELLKVIVAASSNVGDLVLDPFSGSGTTLHAANDLERRWIGIDESFAAMKSSLTRLRRGTKAMGDYVVRQAKESSKVTSLFEELPQQRRVSQPTRSAKFKFVVDSELLSAHSLEIKSLAST